MMVGELDLRRELEAIRKSLLPGQKALSTRQAIALHDSDTPEAALETLTIGAIDLLDALRAEDLVFEHPAIGALSTLLHHPQADASLLRFLQATHRPRAEEALQQRVLEWSPEQLEWQLIQYVKVVGDNVPLQPRVPMSEQRFASKPLQEAWNLLMDLTVLRARGLVV